MHTITSYLFAAGLLISAGSFAQTAPKQPAPKEEKKVEKKEITIEKKEGSKKETMIIKIDGNNVTINGQPAGQYKGKERIVIDDDIVINGNSVRVPGQSRTVTVNGGGNRPLLGVVTEKADEGVVINDVTEGSGAEKAGLLEGDIITTINKTVISSPQQLSETIGKSKPGDEIDVEYLRDGKKRKVKATLGKNNETYTINTDDFNYNFNGGKPYSFTVPRMPEMPRMPEWDGQHFERMMIFGSSTPRYGMNIQDDEDGRGVKVTEVEDDSNAEKGGLKEDDIITEVDGEKIKDVDELKAKLGTKKEQLSVNVKILRAGKTENLTIKVPRKLKSASL